VLGGKINRNAYKEVVEAVFMQNADPEAYIAEKGLMMVNDDKVVEEAISKVIAENEAAVAEYRAGKEKTFGFLMGQVMRKLAGKGNPDMAKKLLISRIKGG
jgi:aspartyl-tRNA(Asn)/glutamyl-tRNA(Gln) amidotransferase subunit B